MSGEQIGRRKLVNTSFASHLLPARSTPRVRRTAKTNNHSAQPQLNLTAIHGRPPWQERPVHSGTTTQPFQLETSLSSWENDKALIAALLARTPDAGRSFIARHDAFFRKVVLSASPAAWVVVDDLTQDVYVHLWRDDFRVLRHWQREHPLRAYLHTVITRLVWDRLSRLQPAREQLADDPWTVAGARLGQSDPPPTPEEEVAANEFAQIARDALDGLSTSHRRVIELRYVGELSYREIAVVLGITPNNAGVRIARALAHLKQTLRALPLTC